jgi:hypothetical protein
MTGLAAFGDRPGELIADQAVVEIVAELGQHMRIGSAHTTTQKTVPKSYVRDRYTPPTSHQ